MRAGCGWALFAVLLTGCAGYQLGPTGGRTAGATSIQVNPFVNQTLEPRLSEAVTSSLRKRLQQDGTYRLDTRNEGDLIVTGTILDYDRSGVSYQPNDTRTPQDYLVVITTRVVARQRATGKVILDRKVTGRTMVRAGADLSSAERQAVPLLAEDMARNLTVLLTEGDW
jgi:hypothetical protein